MSTIYKRNIFINIIFYLVLNRELSSANQYSDSCFRGFSHVQH